MTRRKEIPIERKLNVRWSTQEWVPPIQLLPASESAGRLGVQLLSLTFDRRKPRKRREVTVLWVRNSARNGSNGSRQTWR